MLAIERTSAFKKDYKRIQSNPRHRDLDAVLEKVLQLLISGSRFPTDHALAGEWKDHRECHLKPDLLLIYFKPTPETLRLVRLGTHSDLF